MAALRTCGLLSPGAAAHLTPLTGGVCSDIFKVETDEGRVLAIKRLLGRMRVEKRWVAPANRAGREAAWLRQARTVNPDFAPEVLAEGADGRFFVMAYLDEASHPVWKSILARGEADLGFAAAVGGALAQIHAATAHDTEVAARFEGDETFLALRVRPFLLHAAAQNPDVAPRVRDLASDLATRRIALVHGDVSPKNILVGPKGPVFLDAETVVYGDPAFDLAFVLSHLLLKAVWVRRAREPMARAFAALNEAYLAGVTWEDPGELAGRAAPLIAALLLARVDGKSPAPYLTDPADQAFVRDHAKIFLNDQRLTLERLVSRWREGVAGLAS